MKSWAGIAILALLAVAGLHMAATAGAGAGLYYLGLFMGGASVILIFLFIGQGGRSMPDRFLPDTDVDRPGALGAMLLGFGILAVVGAILALGTSDRDLEVAGILFIIAAVIAAIRAIGRFFDLQNSGPGH
jgi:hypothetical protein